MIQEALFKAPEKSKFDLSHEKKLTVEAGRLIPVLCEEVVPGDVFNISSEFLIRLQPLVSPAYVRLNAYIHYFFVPNRLLWSDWEKFISGDDLAIPTIYLDSSSLQTGTLWDYFGLPTKSGQVSGALEVLRMPFQAYNLIYNEYYRDQNLVGEVGLDPANVIWWPYKRAWSKDYFTGALPWAQKGDPVQFPVVNTVNYKSNAQAKLSSNGANATGTISATSGAIKAGVDNIKIENIDTISSFFTINNFRFAYRLSRWLEKQARAGSRYIETIAAHFNIIGDDARLQRPEYIGGGKSNILISEVVNNYGRKLEDTQALPQGNLAGHGISVGETNKAYYKSTEHGWIIGIFSIIPEADYFQGVHKKFTRQFVTDYYWPEFANLGEQEVKQREIYATGSGSDENVFGYQSRYAEYRHAMNSIHGDFRTTMKAWHDAREFSAAPNLNQTFIECTPGNNFFAVPATRNYLVNIYHRIDALRPMPADNSPLL